MKLYRPGICKNNDHDQDNIFDLIDVDDDNDGLPDIVECPEQTDPSVDDDNDGILNYLDPDIPGYVDSNGDTVNDVFDRDLDGVPDFWDLDSDNDGIMDVIEAGGNDPDLNGIIENITITDTDFDGLEDSVDTLVFGSTPGIPLPNVDTDGDGIPNAEDIDSDTDGIPDNREGQVTIGYIAPLDMGTTDSDFDGLNDAYDIFFNQYNSMAPFGSFGDPVVGGNALQPVNTDMTDEMDYVEADSDNDIAPDWLEGFDDDEDGITADDLTLRATNYETANANPGQYPVIDADNNDVPDFADDTDLDGIPDFLDPDAITVFRDTDQDGLIDLYDEDQNGVGYGAATVPFREPNNDNDSAPNYRDTDDVGCLQIVTATFTGDTSVCVGADIMLQANDNGAQSYTWRKGSDILSNTQTLTIVNVTLANAGNDYSLEVVNDCGSTINNYTIEVFAAPDIGFTGNTRLCEGDTLTLIANEASATGYTWRRDGVVIGNDRTLQILNVSPADASDAYILEIDNGSCSLQSDSIEVRIDDLPTSNLNISAAETTLCASNTGTNITITNTEIDVIYQLFLGTSGVGTAVFGNGGDLILATGPITTPGLNTFRVIATRGVCLMTFLDQSVDITIDALPQTDLSLSVSDSTLCTGNNGVDIRINNSEADVEYQLFIDGGAIGAPQMGNGNALTISTGPLNAIGDLNFVVVTSRGACQFIPLDTTLNIVSADSLDATISIASVAGGGNGICGGAPSDFMATVTNAGNNPAVEWFVNDISVGTGGVNFTLGQLFDGDRVRATLTSSLPCVAPVSSNEVTVASLPSLDLDINADITEGVPGCELTIQVSGAQTYDWTPSNVIISQSQSGDEIVVSPSETTTFFVTGTDANGCTGTDSLTITIVPEEEIFIPSLFSPNGDRNNDTFLVHGECIREITLRVFDRAGNQVYIATSVEQATQIGWDGKHEGVDQPHGKYLWTIEGTSTTGNELKFEGKTRGLINLFR